MPIDRKALILGITGSFGGGCTTLAKALAAPGYKRVSLSEPIKLEWSEREKRKKAEAIRKEPQKKELQDIGNELRESKGAHILAETSVQQADTLGDGSLVVFDGIRNAEEVDFLRHTFPNFYLITVWCPQHIRWDRVKNEYKDNHKEFLEDDKRDHNEETTHGQQVQLCVDKADIVIRNDDSHHPEAAAVQALKNKVAEYLSLLKGETVRAPHHDEVAMATAFTHSLRSQCLKRTVGAVITDRKGRVIATGYNENPEPLTPCPKLFNYCYKDARLREQIESMVAKRPACPLCGEHIEDFKSLGENFSCKKCRKSLALAYAPDRGMSRCTAIHAENMAIMNAGKESLRDAILYTTTFPCSQCARQITYAGINEVVYIEPYPDPDSKDFLEKFAQVRVRVFEGVKARAYERVFGSVRGHNEKKYSLK
ncbi:deaminase [Nitrospira sp. Nam74]